MSVNAVASVKSKKKRSKMNKKGKKGKKGKNRINVTAAGQNDGMVNQQLAAMREAQRALEEAKAQMRAAQEAQASIQEKVENMRREARLAEAQKERAEENLKRVNAEMATGEEVPAGNPAYSDESQPTVPSYSEKEYWNSRYQKQGKDSCLQVAEWYVDSLDQLLPFFGDVDKASASVLDVGCGSSTIGEQLCMAGFKDVTCIDYSEAVISQCQSRKTSAAHSGLEYRAMDARNMAFSDDTFDIIMDKGTMDAMLSAGSGHGGQAADEAILGAGKMMKEVYRVLSSKSGRFLLVSSIPQQIYMPTLENLSSSCSWNIAVHHIKNNASDLPLSVYVLTKSQTNKTPRKPEISAPGAPQTASSEYSIDGLPFPISMIEEVVETLRAQELQGMSSHSKPGKRTPEENRAAAEARKQEEHSYAKLVASEAAPRKLIRIDDTEALSRGKLRVRWDIDVSKKVGVSSGGVVRAGNERDYIVLTKSETSIVDVHIYEEMEWVDGNLSGELELPLPRAKNSTPNKAGVMYEFRYVAEAVAWGLKRDVIIAKSVCFDPFRLLVSTNQSTSGSGSNPNMHDNKEIKAEKSVGIAKMHPYAPPVKLRYLLEKRSNISCYQLFIHRPVAAVGTVPKNVPSPPIPSPVHVRLHLENQYAPELCCERQLFRLSFTVKGAEHSLELSFAECEIDPRKCTIRAQEKHWSVRLPFYYGGSELGGDIISSKLREAGPWKRPRPIELNRSCIMAMACAFCEGPIINSQAGKDVLGRVSEAPSAYWAELSDFWFCLRADAEVRLQQLKGGASQDEGSLFGGGSVDVPIRKNSVVVGKADIIMRQNDVDLGLDKSLLITEVDEQNSVQMHHKAALASSDSGTSQGLSNFECLDDGCLKLDTSMLDLPTAGVVMCRRCRSPLGTSHARSDGTTAVRLWKWRLSSSTNDGNEVFGGQIYTAESVVGHAILDMFERKGGCLRKFLLEGFEILDYTNMKSANEMGKIMRSEIGVMVTVLSAGEEAQWEGERGTGNLRPIIRVLWELVKTSAHAAEPANENSTLDFNRVLVGADAVNSVIEALKWSNSLLPEDSRQLGGKQIGFLCW